MSCIRPALATLALLALPACGAPAPQAVDFRSAVESGAPYRDAARRLYKAMLT